LISIIINIYCF